MNESEKAETEDPKADVKSGQSETKLTKFQLPPPRMPSSSLLTFL